MSDKQFNEESDSDENKHAGKSKKKHEKHNDGFSFSDLNFLTKIFSPLKVLIKLHLRIAQKELKRDIFRYIAGIISLILSFFLIIMFFVIANILVIFLFKYFVFNYYDNLLDYILSISASLGVNFFFFLILIISAIANFKKPFLKETKKAIKETLNDLK